MHELDLLISEKETDVYVDMGSHQPGELVESLVHSLSSNISRFMNQQEQQSPTG